MDNQHLNKDDLIIVLGRALSSSIIKTYSINFIVKYSSCSNIHEGSMSGILPKTPIVYLFSNKFILRRLLLLHE